MLAVGLSSRPASRSKQPSAGGGSQLDSPRRGPGGPVFVLIVPEQPLLLAIPVLGTDAVATRTNGGGAICGMAFGSEVSGYANALGWADQSVIAAADIAIAPPPFGLASRSPWSVAAGELSPTEIRLAIDRAHTDELAATRLPSLDYLSHYDPVYDAAMTVEFASPAARPAVVLGDDDQVDLLTLFSTFVPPTEMPRLADLPRIAKSPSAAADRRSARRWDYEANSIFRGAAQRAWKALLETRLSDDWESAEEQSLGRKRRDELLYHPLWEDYEALLSLNEQEAAEFDPSPTSPSSMPAVAARDTQPTQSATIDLPPTAELLQITVSSLNRVAEMVGQTLQLWLQEAGIRVASKPIEGQSTK
jgi:hypothetical protein